MPDRIILNDIYKASLVYSQCEFNNQLIVSTVVCVCSDCSSTILSSVSPNNPVFFGVVTKFINCLQLNLC